MDADHGAKGAGSDLQLALGCSVKCFDSDDAIFSEGEAADFIYRVISGAVRDVHIAPGGGRQLSAFHLHGEIFGLEQGPVHHCSSEAVVNSEIALVCRRTLESSVADNAALASELWSLSPRDLHRIQRHMRDAAAALRLGA